MNPKIFLIGLPGCGKTTIIQKVLAKISMLAAGFYTQEIRQKGSRRGFLIKTLDGKEAVLAGIGIKSKYRVGKYGVNLEGIENTAVPSIKPKTPEELIVIDEVGKMECSSQKFRETVLTALNLENPLLATFPQKGTPFIESLKKNPNILSLFVTTKNRNGLPEKIISLLKENI